MPNLKAPAKTAVAYILLAAAPFQAGADETRGYGLEIGASTLGAYAAPSLDFGRVNLGIRAPLYFLDHTASLDDSNGNNINGLIQIKSGGLVADYYLGSTGIRFSGGIAVGGYIAKADIQNPMLDGHSYDALIHAQVTQTDNVTPVFSVGYHRQFRNQWGILTEVGARLSSLSLTASGQENLPEIQRNSFDTDIRQINDNLGEIKAVPFATIGLSFNY